MKRSLSSAAFVAGLLFPASLLAQCMGFDRLPRDNPNVVLADGVQRVLIYHANGVERLVLQPSYKGVARDFGIFLTVPEIPLIEKADEAIFRELEVLTTPPPPQVVARAEKVAPTVAAESWRGVSEISRQMVGVYEAVVLQASDRSSFTDWLKKNGYTWPKEVEPIFDHYVREKWFFVAMRVRRDTPVEQSFSGSLQPISVRFTQDKILMPMKMTSPTPGGVDFAYYLITDGKLETKSLRPDLLKFSAGLLSTPFGGNPDAFPQLANTLAKDVLLTRQDDLSGLLESVPDLSVRFRSRLWLTKYQGHFDLADLKDDFVWNVVPGTALSLEAAVKDLSTPQREKVLAAHRKGMRRVKEVRLSAEVFDTNEGYGKPTFVNGIHVGDLASIGGEGSDRWQTVTMTLPPSVVHWLGETVTVKVENYGFAKPGKPRQSDAYNIRNVRIVVDYDDGTTWESKRFAETRCSVPQWKNCQGERVKRWGDPVVFRF